MCSDPVDPGGEVRGCSLGCTIAMSNVSPLEFIMRPFFAYKAKKPLHTGVRTGWHHLICSSFCLSYLSVCLCMCNIRRFLLITRAVQGRFPRTRDLWKRASMGLQVGRVSLHAVSRWSRSSGCCGFRGVRWVWQDFVILTYIHFQLRARVHGRWLRETQSSQHRLDEGATTASQSARRELAPTDPHHTAGGILLTRSFRANHRTLKI